MYRNKTHIIHPDGCGLFQEGQAAKQLAWGVDLASKFAFPMQSVRCAGSISLILSTYFEDLLLTFWYRSTPSGFYCRSYFDGSGLFCQQRGGLTQSGYISKRSKIQSPQRGSSFGGYSCSTNVDTFFSTEMILLPGCPVWKNSCWDAQDH